MKLTITHLKAPWPAGAVVGGVIELAAVPAWALGKCVPAADDVELTVSVKSASTVEKETKSSIDDLRAQAIALGIKPDGRWSRERLLTEIEKVQE